MMINDQTPAAQPDEGLPEEEQVRDQAHLVNSEDRPQEGDEDDFVVPTLEEQRLECLQTARDKVETFLAMVSRELRAFPEEYNEMLDGKLDVTLRERASFAVPPGPEREQLLRLIAEIEAIVHEKGFRWCSSLSTPREHDAIGSSGYGGIYWETDPDIPVPLLAARLVADGKMAPEEAENREMTLEEIDRARRLAGRTSLDPTTGRVTKTKSLNAMIDSCYFLSAARKQEVRIREQQIFTELLCISDWALASQGNVRTIMSDLEKYSQGLIWSPEMEARWQVIAERYNNERYSLDLGPEIETIKRLAFQMGKRDAVLTPQEIALRTSGGVPARYLARPYVPLSVQDNLMSVAEVTALRAGERFMVINSGIMEYEMRFGFRLEELDESGATVRGPTFVERTSGETAEDEKFREHFGSRINFPFARSGDWFSNKHN